MMKHFRTGLMSAAWLIFATSSFCQLATAYTLDQFHVAAKILISMEDDAKALRDKLEEVYKQRCDDQTLRSCIRSNYNDCSSAFPKPKCTFIKPQCGDSPTRCDGGGGCDSDSVELMMPDSVPEVITPDCNVAMDFPVSNKRFGPEK